MTENSSETVIEEHGTFKRTYRRKGAKKKVKTERKKKNPEKVVLAKMGDLELYVYPYSYPDKIFIGSYPKFTQVLEMSDLPKFFVFFNRAKWFLNGEWQKGYISAKGLKIPRHRIVRAYNYALDKQKKAKKGFPKHNYN